MLGWSMAAVAQQITFTGVEGTNYGGFYTGIYYGTLNGTPNTEFICDDATHDINTGDVWNANAYTLAAGANDVANTFNGQFTSNSMAPTFHYSTAATNTSPTYNLCPGGSCTLQDSYDAVAYLADLILTGVYKTDPTVSAIQYAIWSIMDGPPPGPGTNTAQPGLTTSDTGYWIYLALTTESGYTNSKIVFYSPDGNKILPGSPDQGLTSQEFIGYDTPTVPEPLSMALMGTFLTLAGLVLGRKKLLS